MDDLIQCTKCQTIPNDVLMMNCGHNLCVKCAVQRMKYQNISKIAIVKYLQCEKCKTKTNLDQESINQLQKAKKEGYKQGQKRMQTPINSVRVKINGSKQDIKGIANQKIIRNSSNASQTGIEHSDKGWTVKQKKQQTQYESKKKERDIAKEMNYGQCSVHRDQPIMYYCFTCKIHCFCAQCVLQGKHNKHDVKVIKKAYAIVEKETQEIILKTKQFITQLLEKNKTVVNSINNSKNKADEMKKNIQKKFDEIRILIRQKQQQFMRIVDQQLVKMLEKNNGAIRKAIDSKLKQQQDILNKLQSTCRSNESTMLNFYSDQWKHVHEITKNQTIALPNAEQKIDEALIQYISALGEHIRKMKIKQYE